MAVHLLFGGDAFTIEEDLARRRESVGTADLRDLNITALDGTGLNFDLLTATCDTVPFLAEKRLVIVQGLLSQFERRAPSRARARGNSASSSPLGRWKGLPEYLTRVPETTELVFIDGRLDRSNPLLKAIRSCVKEREFRLPSSNELRQWIRNRATTEKIEIEPRAIDTLANTIGSDLRVIATELRKLALYCHGRAIRHEDVEELVSYAKEANIFAAVDNMIEGKPGIAIMQVHQMLQSGRPPSYILSMMARQVRLMILAKEIKTQRLPFAEQGRRLGLSGYPLTKTLNQAERFNASTLVDIHHALLEADLSMKTSGIDEGLVLDMLIAEVATRPSAGARSRSGSYRG